MGSQVVKIAKCIALFAASMALASCQTPGSYFNSAGATQAVQTGDSSYHPHITPVNAPFFLATHKQAKLGKTLWYQPHYAYHVGSSDVLSVIVWDHPELTEPNVTAVDSSAPNVAGISAISRSSASNQRPGILVDNSGNIFFPYAGTLHVAGLTTKQIRQKITEHIRRYIRDPQVSVRVSDFRSQLIHVIGAVKEPGNVPIIDKPLTVLDAIASAGGIDPQVADLSHIFIVRGSALRPQIFLLDAKSPSNLLLSEQFKLYAKDIIYVPAAGISNWNQFVNSVLPTLTTVTYIHALRH